MTASTGAKTSSCSSVDPGATLSITVGSIKYSFVVAAAACQNAAALGFAFFDIDRASIERAFVDNRGDICVHLRRLAELEFFG